MEIVNVLIALASLGFAAFSWWMAHGAKTARDQAEKDRKQVDRQAAAVEAIAESLAGPLLTAQHIGDRDRTIVVRNPSAEDVTLEELVNEADFHMFGSFTRDPVDVWPVMIPSGSLHRFYASMNVGYPMPDQFVFRVVGREELVHVGIEPADGSLER